MRNTRWTSAVPGLGFVLALALVLAGAAPAPGQDDEVRVSPLSMTTQVDVGQIRKGHLDGALIEEKFLQRTSVWLTRTKTSRRMPCCDTSERGS